MSPQPLGSVLVGLFGVSFLGLFLGLGQGAAHAQGQTAVVTAKPGKATVVAPVDEPQDEDEPLVETGVSGRVMTGFEYVLDKPTVAQGNARTEEWGFFLKQARLEWEAELADHFSAEVSFELSDGLNPKISALDIDRPQYVRDAFIDAKFSREFRLRAGHFKRPFSRLALTSSGKLPIRGRGLLDSVLMEDARWGDRALGAMLFGKFKLPKLEYSLALMQPQWEPARHYNGYDLVGRLEYEPFRWLTVSANGARKSVDLTTRQATGHAVGGDLLFRFWDASIQVEGSYGDLVFDPSGPAAFGAHLLSSVDFPLWHMAVLQPTLFVEYADAHSVFLESESVRVAGGVNLVYYDRYRIMPQVGVTKPLGEASEFNPWPEQYEYLLMFTLDVP